MTDWDNLLLKDRKFTFTVTGKTPNTFAVLEFSGAESISSLFEYAVTLVSDDHEIDLQTVIDKPAVLTIFIGETNVTIHGMVSEFDQLHQVEGKTVYRALLVPRISTMGRGRSSEVYTGMTVPAIIAELFRSHGFADKTDFSLELHGDYPQWTHLCQYQESDLDFISRWMEHYGIYYYFDHSGDVEKLVITDTHFVHTPLGGKIKYSPPTGKEIDVTSQVLHSVILRGKGTPAQVKLTDYNYRHSGQPVEGTAAVSGNGHGVVAIRGEHVKTKKQADDLAKIRAEEILSRETVIHCEGTVAPVRAGFLCEIEGHYRASINRKYLAVSVEREGSQTGFILTGLGGRQAERDLIYRSVFDAIPDDKQFRPERKTPKPRITGTLNAFVDAEGSGKYAELDEFGRYKVKLPFGKEKNPGKSSRWIRLSTPYAGDKHGMHFPIHKGSEVLLTFVDGDPDRPIIQGALPNSTHDSVVNSKNATINSLVTAGGNAIHLNDQENSQSIRFESPTGKTFLRLGATKSNSAPPAGGEPKPSSSGAVTGLTPEEKKWLDEQMAEQKKDEEAGKAAAASGWTCNVQAGDGMHLKTEAGYYVCCAGEYQEHVRGTEKKWVDGDSVETVKGHVSETVKGGETKVTHGISNEHVFGVELKTIVGPVFEFVAGEEIKVVGSLGLVAEACGALGKFGFATPGVIDWVLGWDIKFKNLHMENTEAKIEHIDGRLQAIDADLATKATATSLTAARTRINGTVQNLQGQIDDITAEANRAVGVMAATIGAQQQAIAALQRTVAAMQAEAGVRSEEAGLIAVESGLQNQANALMIMDG